jgi:hypothetical protein
MVDATGPLPPLTGQDRRRIAARTLADTPGIGCGSGRRRPAPALTGHRRERLVASTIEVRPPGTAVRRAVGTVRLAHPSTDGRNAWTGGAHPRTVPFGARMRPLAGLG